MKQLTLNLTIQRVTKYGYLTDNWELLCYPATSKVENLGAWCGGKSKSQVFHKFIKAISDKDIRYWSMLEDK